MLYLVRIVEKLLIVKFLQLLNENYLDNLLNYNCLIKLSFEIINNVKLQT